MPAFLYGSGADIGHTAVSTGADGHRTQLTSVDINAGCVPVKSG